MARMAGLILLGSVCAAFASDFRSLCADRSAIERVYYNHRLGQKPPFEQTLPQATVEMLVRQDLWKEAALKNVYGVEITPAMLDAERQRIDSTTRAPETLAELKAALGNDPARFANALARPMVVERLLRNKFENDDALHNQQRQEMERARNDLIAARKDGADGRKLVALLNRSHSNDVTEVTWQVTARPGETNAPDADEIKHRFGPDAQILSPQPDGNAAKVYFEDLPVELQRVLRLQLREAGDVSAVIEIPAGFLLYVAKEKNAASLSVARLSLPKRNYEQWLEEQRGLPTNTSREPTAKLRSAHGQRSS